jgi:hypothetical protein
VKNQITQSLTVSKNVRGRGYSNADKHKTLTIGKDLKKEKQFNFSISTYVSFRWKQAFIG